MNSIYNDFKGTNPLGQMGDFLTQFNQFRSMFTGNPEAQVKQLLQSGRMSQEQFNQLAQTANQLQKFIK
jgi:hypothetical protein